MKQVFTAGLLILAALTTSVRAQEPSPEAVNALGDFVRQAYVIERELRENAELKALLHPYLSTEASDERKRQTLDSLRIRILNSTRMTAESIADNRTPEQKLKAFQDSVIHSGRFGPFLFLVSLGALERLATVIPETDSNTAFLVAGLGFTASALSTGAYTVKLLRDLKLPFPELLNPMVGTLVAPFVALLVGAPAGAGTYLLLDFIRDPVQWQAPAIAVAGTLIFQKQLSAVFQHIRRSWKLSKETTKAAEQLSILRTALQNQYGLEEFELTYFDSLLSAGVRVAVASASAAKDECEEAVLPESRQNERER